MAVLFYSVRVYSASDGLAISFSSLCTMVGKMPSML